MELNLTPEKLKDPNGTLKSFLNALPAPSIIVDASGLVLHANQKATTRWQRNPADSIGKPIASLESRKIVKKTLADGNAQIGIIETIHGKKVFSNIIPIVNEGTVIGAFCSVIVPDVAYLKHIVSQLSATDADQQVYHTLARNTSRYGFENFIGKSPAIQKLIETCRLAAGTNFPVLITGETGCGKEILAGAIHRERHNIHAKPFIKINCTAIPGDLMESELFGHEKGAFTGASSAQKGKFEIAEDGTILLDEIGDMDIFLQSKLLRVLEEREFERVGGMKVYPLKADIIATTNKNLMQLSAEKRFRSDLYYRLSTLEIYIPPLRERKEDIPLLIGHFLENTNSAVTFTDGALDKLTGYPWPGNVRQLQHFITRVSVLYPHKKIDAALAMRELQPSGPVSHAETDAADSPAYFSQAYPLQPQKPASQSRNQTAQLQAQLKNRTATAADTDMQFPSEICSLKEMEAKYIRHVLAKADGNIAQAARELQISRNTLYNKIK
ncbi:MAG: sigma 54-interacting transcriptional regulator [Eubacterium sp.]|nr:sigma 54-interacting transcriptional regulator [Eubacterium sp.]